MELIEVPQPLVVCRLGRTVCSAPTLADVRIINRSIMLVSHAEQMVLAFFVESFSSTGVWPCRLDTIDVAHTIVVRHPVVSLVKCETNRRVEQLALKLGFLRAAQLLGSIASAMTRLDLIVWRVVRKLHLDGRCGKGRCIQLTR